MVASKEGWQVLGNSGYHAYGLMLYIYWRYCRVIKPAFEGLELLAGKLARAVLRGLGAGNSPRLLGVFNLNF